jgi:hypothetical protein
MVGVSAAGRDRVDAAARWNNEGSFVGMTTEPVTLDARLEARERMFRERPSALDAEEREFLRTLVRAQPDWSHSYGLSLTLVGVALNATSVQNLSSS